MILRGSISNTAQKSMANIPVNEAQSRQFVSMFHLGLCKVVKICRLL